MNFFEEKTDIYYEQFSFWAFAALFTLIQSTISGYPLLWYVVSCIYFVFACIINDWTSYCEDYSTETLADVTYFYIC